MIRFPCKPQKKLACLTVFVLIATVLSILLRIGCLLWFYDAELGYHQSGALLPVLTNWFLALCVIGCAALSCIFFSKDEISLPVPMGLSRLSALFPAACALVAAFGPHLTGRTEGYVTALPFQPSTLFLISAVCAVAVFAFFVLLAIGFPKKGYALPIVLLGLGALIYFIVSLGIAYFDFEVQMNSPNKLTLQLALLCAMLAMLSELRILSGGSKPRMALFSFSVATILLGTSSIPSIAAYLLKIFPASYRNLFTDVACLGFWLYCLIRMLCIAFPKKMEEASIEEPTEENPADTADPQEPQITD